MIRKNNLAALPFVFTQSGRWWGTNPKTHQAEEIDMVFSDAGYSRFIFAECKWRNNLKDTAALENLIEKSELLKHEYNNHVSTNYCLFSKTSFSKPCGALARQLGNVSLIGLKELFSFK